MKPTLPILLLLLLIPQAISHAQADVTGTWQNEVLSRQVLFLWTFELTQAGTELSGTVHSTDGQTSIDIADGRVDGNTVTFSIASPDGDRTVTLSGTLAGDEIAFARDVELRDGTTSPGFGLGDVGGTKEFTLRRVPEGRPPARPRGLPFPRQLTVFNGQGERLRTIGEPGIFNQPALSPDGTRMAVVESSDLWVFDFTDDSRIRLDAQFPGFPIWSPDGTAIVFSSFRQDDGGLYRIPADGSGPEELVYRHSLGAFMSPTDWSADGRFLAFDSGAVLYAVDLERPGPSERGNAIEIARSEFDLASSRFSSNSRYLAYRSDESGRDEIYVRPFGPLDPAGANHGPWQISDEGGIGMIDWEADGRQLHYLASDGHMMVVDVTTDGPFTAGAPRRQFRVPDTIPLAGPQARFARGMGSMRRDGTGFVFAVPQPPDRPEVSVALEVLERYVGTYASVFGGANVAVTLEDGRLSIEGLGVKRAMLAASETTFFFKTYNGEIDFVMDDDGQVTHINVWAFGTGARWTRQ